MTFLFSNVFGVWMSGASPIYTLYGNCSVFTNFQRTELYAFQNLSVRFILKIS